MARKRMLLSLEDELHSALMDFSKETGAPAATFVAEVLEEMKPKIVQLTKMIRLTKEKSTDAGLNRLKDLAENASLELKELVEELNQSQNHDEKKPSDNNQS